MNTIQCHLVAVRSRRFLALLLHKEAINRRGVGDFFWFPRAGAMPSRAGKPASMCPHPAG
ncbi:MAG: hypothetical protein ABFS56_32895 [Pseudomonadota bacterium]